MGGAIWVESVRGPGQHVSLHGALRRPAGAGEPQPALPARSCASLPVLVVDDNATNRRILEEMLTRWQMRPVAVDSGSSALHGTRSRRRRLASRSPLVLLDAQMPGDGRLHSGRARSVRAIPNLAGATS